MTATPDANDVLFGTNAPTAKFDDPGTTFTGTIATPPRSFHEREYDPNNIGGGAPKYFPSGDPIYGLTIDIQTTLRDPSIQNDSGLRTIYVQGKRLKDALRDAVRAAGAQKLEVGSEITVTFTHREDPMDKRSAKHWTVNYVPVAQAAVFGQQAQQPVTTQPVYQQPPAAPAQAYAPPVQAPPAQYQAPTPTAPVQQAPAAPVAAGPSPEQIEGMLAAGMDPRIPFPGVQLTPEQLQRVPNQG